MSLRQEIEQLTPALRRLARALVTGDAVLLPDGADDLVHETLLRALRFDSPAKGFSTHHWLCALLVSIHRQQSRQVQQGHVEADGAEQNIRHWQNFQSRASTRRSTANFPSNPPRDAISTSLGQLVVEEREALLLVALEGLSHADAAHVLGLPKMTLIARLARARGNLAQHSHSSHARNVPDMAHLRLVR